MSIETAGDDGPQLQYFLATCQSEGGEGNRDWPIEADMCCIANEFAQRPEPLFNGDSMQRQHKPARHHKLGTAINNRIRYIRSDQLVASGRACIFVNLRIRDLRYQHARVF